MKIPYLKDVTEAGLDEATLTAVIAVVEATKHAASMKVFPDNPYAVAVTSDGMKIINLDFANDSEQAAEMVREACRQLSAKTVMIVAQAWHLVADEVANPESCTNISKHPKAKEAIYISIETSTNIVVGVATIKKKKIGLKKPTGELGEFKWLVCDLMSREEANFGELLPKQQPLF